MVGMPYSDSMFLSCVPLRLSMLGLAFIARETEGGGEGLY